MKSKKMTRSKTRIIYILGACIPLSFIFTILVFVYETPDVVNNFSMTIRNEIKIKQPVNRRTNKKIASTILFWSSLYGRINNWEWWFKKSFLQQWCPEELDCVFTWDKQRLNVSDAVLFHGFLNDLNRSQMPSYRLPHQRWIYVLNEPPQVPSRNLTQFNDIFNWTLTYRRESDIFGGYGQIFLEDSNDIRDGDINHAANKTRLVAWFVSHCFTSGKRENFVKELQKYISVDVYGECGNGTFSCKNRYSFECFKMLEDRYKFYLAFENHICTDYITEKFFGILPYYVVPVVYGGSGYDNIVPVGSYINALDFESPKRLAEYLLQVDKDDEVYNKFFNWKKGKRVKIIRWQRTDCEICRKVRDRSLPVKVYSDLGYWWNTLSNCHRWENGKIVRNP